MRDPEIGSIVLWQGAIIDIPENWILCDGANGTPDLRDKMVVGSNGIYAQDQVGGSAQHNHDFTADGHVHRFNEGPAVKSGDNYAGNLTNTPLAGTSENATAPPPYYSLAYIMFVGD